MGSRKPTGRPRGNPNFEPVVIRDRYFPSMTAAALYHNRSVAAISQAKKFGRLNHVGLTTGRDRMQPPKPCNLDGVDYPSITAASKALGIPRGKVRALLDHAATRGNEQ